MNDRDRELERWIERARMDAPSAEQLARTRERLLSSAMGPTPAHPAAEPKSAATNGGAPVSSGAVGVGIKVVAVSILLGVGLVALRTNLVHREPASVAPPHAPQAPEPPQPAPAAPAPAAVTRSAPADAALPTTAVPARDPQPARTRAPRRPARNAARDSASTPRNDAPEQFTREVALLKAAIEAHRRGDDADARKKLAEHEQTYPHSALEQERKRLSAELDAKP
jgi:hypothetical protein